VVKIVVLYGAPQDAAAFEEHYASTHAGLVAQIPNLQRFEPARVVATPDGSEPPYYRIAELWFASEEDLGGAMSSPEGQATVADLANFASGGAQVMIAAVD